MPLYDFRCKNGHTKEIRLKFDDRNQAQMCDCGESLNRVPSTPQIPADGTYSYGVKPKRPPGDF